MDELGAGVQSTTEMCQSGDNKARASCLFCLIIAEACTVRTVVSK